jgi:hypothetical protein
MRTLHSLVDNRAYTPLLTAIARLRAVAPWAKIGYNAVLAAFLNVAAACLSERWARFSTVRWEFNNLPCASVVSAAVLSIVTRGSAVAEFRPWFYFAVALAGALGGSVVVVDHRSFSTNHNSVECSPKLLACLLRWIVPVCSNVYKKIFVLAQGPRHVLYRNGWAVQVGECGISEFIDVDGNFLLTINMGHAHGSFVHVFGLNTLVATVKHKFNRVWLVACLEHVVFIRAQNYVMVVAHLFVVKGEVYLQWRLEREAGTKRSSTYTTSGEGDVVTCNVTHFVRRQPFGLFVTPQFVLPSFEPFWLGIF